MRLKCDFIKKIDSYRLSTYSSPVRLVLPGSKNNRVLIRAQWGGGEGCFALPEVDLPLDSVMPRVRNRKVIVGVSPYSLLGPTRMLSYIGGSGTTHKTFCIRSDIKVYLYICIYIFMYLYNIY